MNENRTASNSDTDLTQARSPDVPWAGVTYFVRAGDAIKIGFATNLKDRLVGLQTSHPDELEVLAAISANDVDEYATHQKFAHLRLRGEWFQADKELLDFIDYAKLKFGEAAPHKPAPRRKAIKYVPKIDPITGGLKKLRDAHGAHTRAGRRCSNIMEMLDAGTAKPADIARQVRELAELTN